MSRAVMVLDGYLSGHMPGKGDSIFRHPVVLG